MACASHAAAGSPRQTPCRTPRAGALLRPLGVRIGDIFRKLRWRYSHRLAMRRLLSLDDRLSKDIGLSRSQVDWMAGYGRADDPRRELDRIASLRP